MNMNYEFYLLNKQKINEILTKNHYYENLEKNLLKGDFQIKFEMSDPERFYESLKDKCFLLLHLKTKIIVNLIYKNKYKIEKIFSRKGEKFFQILDVEKNERIVVDHSYFDSDPVSQNRRIYWFVNYLKYLDAKEKYLKKKYLEENISIKDNLLYFCCCMYLIDNFGYFRDYERPKINNDLLNRLKDGLDLFSTEKNIEMIKLFLRKKENTLYSSLILYMMACEKNSEIINKLNILEYSHLYDDFLSYVQEKHLNDVNNSFLSNAFESIHEKNFRIKNLRIILSTIKMFDEKNKYFKHLDSSTIAKILMKSKFVGNVKDFVEIDNCVVFMIKNLKNYKLINQNKEIKVFVYDKDYNVFCFFISEKRMKKLSLNIFDNLKLSGKIIYQRENSDNGVKENIINRVRILK